MIRVRGFLGLAGIAALLIFTAGTAYAEHGNLKVRCSATGYQNALGRWIVLACDPGYYGALTQFIGSSSFYSGEMLPMSPMRQHVPMLYPGGALYQGRAFPPPPNIDCNINLVAGMVGPSEILICDAR